MNTTENGTKRIRKKSTVIEMEERIQFAETLLRSGPLYKHQMKKLIREKFNVGWQMAEEYLRRARERLLLKLAEAKQEQRAESLAFYEGVILNPASSQADRIRARERIDKLLGLDAPQQFEHTAQVVSKETVEVEDLPLDLETKKKLLMALREAKARKPSNANQ